MTRLYGLRGVVVLLCFVHPLFAKVLTAQTPPRDNTPAPAVASTAVVRGRITAAATGQPLYRVRITMNGAVANPPTAVTDAEGVFEITQVPAGTYSITAARSGYLTVQYGQRRPRESGRTLQVRNGDVIEHIDMALFAGAVLAGRIVDELGEPAPGVRVEAMDLQFTRGRRLPLQAGFTTTNDLGEFRLGGLQPGTYYLRASTTAIWESEDAKKGTLAYAQTYFPGALIFERAETINLATGQEVAGLDFPLVVGRAVRVSGILQSSGGEAMPGQRVSLQRLERTIGGAMYSLASAGSAQTDRIGGFEIGGVPPGEYVLAWGNTQTEVANLSFVVTEDDVQSVVLTPRKTSSLRGSITTDEGAPPSFPAARIRISPISADGTTVMPAFAGGAPTPQPVGSDWSFRFATIEGPYFFRTTGLPDDWMLSAVRMNGRDITDVPFDIPKGGMETSGLEMVLTRKTAKISGDVVGSNAAPLADSTVLVFASDDRRWGLGTRYVKSARPDNTGHFSVGGLPAGSYLAIARDFVIDGQWEDPDYLRSLVPDASKIELSEGGDERVTLTLKQEAQR